MVNSNNVHLEQADRKLNSDKKKQIVEKINRMENYLCIYQIGKILSEDQTVKNDKSSYTINNNGFHIRISKLSDATIKKLDHFLTHDYKKIINDSDNIIEVSKGSVFHNLTDTSADETNVRLSSKEKKFFKKMQTAA
jgi:hypothetical protein